MLTCRICRAFGCTTKHIYGLYKLVWWVLWIPHSWHDWVFIYSLAKPTHYLWQTECAQPKWAAVKPKVCRSDFLHIQVFYRFAVLRKTSVTYSSGHELWISKNILYSRFASLTVSSLLHQRISGWKVCSHNVLLQSGLHPLVIPKCQSWDTAILPLLYRYYDKQS